MPFERELTRLGVKSSDTNSGNNKEKGKISHSGRFNCYHSHYFNSDITYVCAVANAPVCIDSDTRQVSQYI